MKKYPLIGVSIVAIIVLILASLSNVVGFQTVQSANKRIINEEINQKELLFQTIVDMANNKEIQRIILKSQISKEGFFNPGVRFSIFNHPVLTEKILKRMYTMGVILSKTISKSKMHSMIEQFQVNNQGVQKEINAVIQKDTTLSGEMTQLSSTTCDCENVNTTSWNYPVLCVILYPIESFILILYFFSGFLHYIPKFVQYLFDSIGTIGDTLNCFWA